VIDFFRKLFRQPGSSATAKERLRLVLMTDHLELAPEMIESMKRDLVDVIGRYVEVDRQKIEVNFERQDRALAMLANIPIISVNRPGSNGNGVHVAPESTEAPPNEAAAPHVVADEPQAAEPPAAEPPAAELPPASQAPPSRKRRKRAQKKAGATTATPVPAS
jgi:cell division topological specificity factor